MAKVIQLTAGLRAEYSRQQRERQAAIEALVVAHLELVREIAQRVWRKYTRAGQNGYSSQIDVEDMVACGHIGLVQAAQRYDAAAGPFAKFAYRRIRGAIIDNYRRGAYRDLQNESIEALMPSSDQDRRGEHGASGRHFEFDHLRDLSPAPDQVVAQIEVERLAVRAIRNLPDDERMVIIDALRGAGVEETAEARGRSVAWARAKLASARDKVAFMVARDQRAA